MLFFVHFLRKKRCFFQQNVSLHSDAFWCKIPIQYLTCRRGLFGGERRPNENASDPLYCRALLQRGRGSAALRAGVPEKARRSDREGRGRAGEPHRARGRRLEGRDVEHHPLAPRKRRALHRSAPDPQPRPSERSHRGAHVVARPVRHHHQHRRRSAGRYRRDG